MASKTGHVALTLLLMLLISSKSSEADKRAKLQKIFGYLDFDARDVKLPSAIAPRVPTITVPQYQSSDPIYLQPISNPIPKVMVNGITPYSSLPNPYLTNIERRQEFLYPYSRFTANR